MAPPPKKTPKKDPSKKGSPPPSPKTEEEKKQDAQKRQMVIDHVATLEEQVRTRQEQELQEAAKRAMMDDLRTARNDEFPLEDDHGRHDHHPRRPHQPRTLAPSAERETSAAFQFWKQAKDDGEFDDAEAQQAKVLDDLGGGRVYASHQEMGYHETQRRLASHMNPASMYPESARNRRQELPPHHQTSNVSKLGIVIDPTVPVRRFPNTRVASTSFANGPSATNGRTNGQSAGPASNHQHIAPQQGTMRIQPPTPFTRTRGPPTSNGRTHEQANGRASNRLVPQQGTMRLQPSTPTSRAAGQAASNGHTHGQSNGPAPGRQDSVSQQATTPIRSSVPPSGTQGRPTGSIIEQKRQNSACEKIVKYVKAPGTSKKTVSAVVMIREEDGPHMGNYLLFLLRSDNSTSLEHNIPITIVTLVIDPNLETHVLVRVKESETRESVHRLIFPTAGSARQLISTYALLMSRRPRVVPSAPTAPSTAVPRENEPAQPAAVEAEADAQVQSTSTSSEIEMVNSSSVGVVDESVVGDTARAPVIDLLSDESGLSDNVGNQPVSGIIDDIPRTTNDNSLLDLNEDDSGSALARTDVSSHAGDLADIEWAVAAQHTITKEEEDTSADAIHETPNNIGSDEGDILFPTNAAAASLYNRMVLYSSNMLPLFDITGTYVQRADTVLGIRRGIADLTRNHPVGEEISAEALRNVIKAFIAFAATDLENARKTEKMMEEDRARAENREEASVPEPEEPEQLEDSPTSATTASRSFHSSEGTYIGERESSAPSSTTAVNPRLEYSSEEMLAARAHAVAPSQDLSQVQWPVASPRRRPATLATHAPEPPVVDRDPVPVTPFGRNLAARPAAPPTPETSPVQPDDKLVRRFSELSLKDKPAASPSSPATTEKNPVREAPTADHKPAEHQTNGTQPSDSDKENVTPVAKTPAAVVKPAEQQTNGTRPADNNMETVTPVAATPAAPVDGHLRVPTQRSTAPPAVQGPGLGESRHAPQQSTARPAVRSPAPRAVQPPAPQTVQPTTTQAARLLGLGDSIHARRSNTRVNNEGKFTGPR